MKRNTKDYATTNSTEIIVNYVEAQARPFHIEAVIHSIRTVIVIHLLALVYLVLSDAEDLKVRPSKKSTHSVQFSILIDSFQLSFLKFFLFLRVDNIFFFICVNIGVFIEKVLLVLCLVLALCIRSLLRRTVVISSFQSLSTGRMAF